MISLPSVKRQRWAHGHFSCHSKWLNLPFIVFKVKETSHLSCAQPIRKCRLFLKTLSFGILETRELKNHDDDFVDDDGKWDTVHCASAISKFLRRGVVDDAKHGRITSSCNPQALAGTTPCFYAIFQGLCIFYPRKSRYPFFFLLTSDVDWKFDWWIVFTSKTTLSCGGRASELVSDKFSCT